MHSNETICRKNPVEQSMCAQSALSIRNRPQKRKKKKKIMFVYFLHFQDLEPATLARNERTYENPKKCDM